MPPSQLLPRSLEVRDALSRLLSEPWELPELDRGSAGRLESACSSMVMNQVKTDDCILSKLQTVVSATQSVSNGVLNNAPCAAWMGGSKSSFWERSDYS